MEQTNKAPLGIILGPTASGKTSLGVQVAKRLGGEVISADSIQIYRGLDIGSAKPTREEMEGVPHHMLDVAEVDGAKFSVAAYQQQATAIIRRLQQAHIFPLVVGGTGLYISALTSPLDFTETPGDETLRQALQAQEQREPGSLYAKLQQEDPASAQRLHPNDIKRIVRALEVKQLTGKPIGAAFSQTASAPCPYALTMVGLTMPRPLLYARIEQRVDQMLEQGLVEEARSIWEKGLDPALPALQGLGYKQLFAYFAGNTSLEAAVAAIKQETRHFAKRQMTWFCRDARIHWLDITQYTPEALVDMACGLFRKEV